MMPLPQLSLESGRSSGSSAYFVGPKIAPCVQARKSATAGEIDAIVGEREGGERHDDEFEDFYAEGDAALAVFVGEVAAGDGEDEEGNGEEEWDDQDEPEVALIFVGKRFEDEEADEPLEGVVAEGVLELHGDEGPEAGEAAGRVFHEVGTLSARPAWFGAAAGAAEFVDVGTGEASVARRREAGKDWRWSG